MIRILLTLALGVAIGVVGMAAVQTDHKPTIKLVVKRDISEKVDGKETAESVVEVTLEPGQQSPPHRHPGPVFGYVLEGEYEHAIDDQPTKLLKVGDTFYEPTGCLHRVSKNPAAAGKTRVLAVLLLPRDAKALSTPEPKN
jgi:quercetin dioxygenase-like cupin family protein